MKLESYKIAFVQMINREILTVLADGHLTANQQ